MKPVDADRIQADHPDRRSLRETLESAPEISIRDIIEDIKCDMCDNYCKMPYQFSKNEWEEIAYTEGSPCGKCPLRRL